MFLNVFTVHAHGIFLFPMYKVIQEKNTNTKIAISDKCVNFFHQILLICLEKNYPYLCCIVLCLLYLRQKDANVSLNFNNRISQLNKKLVLIKVTRVATTFVGTSL